MDQQTSNTAEKRAQRKRRARLRTGWNIIRYITLFIVALYTAGYLSSFQFYKINQRKAINGIGAYAPYCYIMDDVDPMAGKLADAAIAKMPVKWQKHFRKYWKFVISSDFISSDEIARLMQQNGQGSVFGQTDDNSKVIHLRYTNDMSADKFTYICLHELGHAFSRETGGSFCAAEYLKLYNEYKGSYQPVTNYVEKQYIQLNEAEFFATIIADTLMDTETMRTQNEQLFVYADSLLARTPPQNLFTKAHCGVANLLRNTKYRIQQKSR